MAGRHVLDFFVALCLCLSNCVLDNPFPTMASEAAHCDNDVLYCKQESSLNSNQICTKITWDLATDDVCIDVASQ